MHQDPGAAAVVAAERSVQRRERMQVETAGGVTVVTLPARVDTTSASMVEAKITHLLDEGIRSLVVDFSANEYVSSAGLRVFLSVLKFLERNDGRIVLCAMPAFVADVFEISGFSGLFTITPTREEALAVFV
jgi:anti-anti-sigma factor